MIGIHYPNLLVILPPLMILKHCWTDIIMIIYLVISVHFGCTGKSLYPLNTNTIQM